MTSILWIFSTGFSTGGPIRLKLFSAEGGEKRTGHPTNRNSPSLVCGSVVLHLQPASSIPSSFLKCSPQHHRSPLPRARHHGAQLSRLPPFINTAPQRGNVPFSRDVGQPLACPCAPHHRAQRLYHPSATWPSREETGLCIHHTRCQVRAGHSLVSPHGPS